MNPGSYHSMLSASQCAVKTHKSESDDVVKRSGGQNSTREKSSGGMNVCHPNICSEKTIYRRVTREKPRQEVDRAHHAAEEAAALPDSRN